MSQKESQKKTTEPLIEEEKDFYLSFINKKIRNARKKLDQIEELQKRDPSTLKAEQQEKINSRAEVLQNMQYYDNLKEVYYSAYKTALEEGKVPPKERSMEKAIKNGDGNKDSKANKPEANAPVSQEAAQKIKDEAVKDTLKKVLNLISISQIFENQSRRQDFLRTYSAENEGPSEEGRASFEDFEHLYQSIFNFRESSESVRVEEKVEQSFEKLVQYVKGEDQTAVGNKSFKNIQEELEKIVAVPSFKDITLGTQASDKINQPENTLIKEEEIPKEELPKEAPVQELATTAADILRPDVDDFSKSPEKGRYLPPEPKMVRFVDEIERDMQNNRNKERDNSESEIQVARESREPDLQETGDHTKEEERDGTNEQKNFRKRRNNDYGYNKSSKYNENSKRTQPNRGFSNYQANQKKYANDGTRSYGRNANETDEYYQGRGTGAKYQYKKYVEKKGNGETH